MHDSGICKTMSILPRSFYMRDTVLVARRLLGKKLVRNCKGNIIAGIIVETEAYRRDDPASHTYIGKTERNKAMFGEVGRAYIYIIHGVHSCVNAVARSGKYEAGGVLIRALKPDVGLDIMRRNRQTNIFKNLTNGPAKLTQALKIIKKQYAIDLTKAGDLFITEGIARQPKIQTGPRIGTSKARDKMWNFKIDI